MERSIAYFHEEDIVFSVDGAENFKKLCDRAHHKSCVDYKAVVSLTCGSFHRFSRFLFFDDSHPEASEEVDAESTAEEPDAASPSSFSTSTSSSSNDGTGDVVRAS